MSASSLGAEFRTNAEVLRAFGRAAGARAAASEVRPAQVDAFLAGKGPRTRTWHKKLGILRAFYQYAVSRGYVAAAPLPVWVPKPPPPFVPYIYSHDELRRLLAAADADLRPRSALEPVTLRTALANFKSAVEKNADRGDAWAQSVSTALDAVERAALNFQIRSPRIAIDR